MRSYKKIKKYVGGSLSKNNKGLLLINLSDISIGTSLTFICTIQNPDGSTSDLVSILYPVLNSGTGLPYSPPAGNSWSIIPFNVVGITGADILSEGNIYELF